MHLKIGNLIKSKTFIHILYRFIRTYSWTFRLTVENEKPWLEHVDAGGRVLLCCWHQQFFSCIRYFQKYNVYKPSLMISQSSDGEMIAGVANLTGWHTVRGSSSKNGQEALQEMVQRLIITRLAAHILDGPRGPVGIVKRGAIHLAKGAEAMIVPIYVTAKKAWYFNSWDRFVLPKPFSKVIIRFGEMIKVHKTEDINFIEKQRKSLEEIMLPALH
jgi:lysophospholipid acyltransferase (LPLAT)-like uncharacterized protein